MLYNVSTYLTFHQITNIFLTPYNVTRPSTLHHTSHTPTRQKLGPLCQLSLTIVGRGVCAKNFRNQSECDDHMSSNNQPKSFNCQFRAISFTSSLVLEWHIETEHEETLVPNHNRRVCSQTFPNEMR